MCQRSPTVVSCRVLAPCSSVMIRAAARTSAGKHRDCAEVGIASIQVELPDSTSQDELEAVIAELNADPACTGYIVQLPLPRHLDDNSQPSAWSIPTRMRMGFIRSIWAGWCLGARAVAGYAAWHR